MLSRLHCDLSASSCTLIQINQQEGKTTRKQNHCQLLCIDEVVFSLPICQFDMKVGDKTSLQMTQEISSVVDNEEDYCRLLDDIDQLVKWAAITDSLQT